MHGRLGLDQPVGVQRRLVGEAEVERRNAAHAALVEVLCELLRRRRLLKLIRHRPIERTAERPNDAAERRREAPVAAGRVDERDGLVGRDRVGPVVSALRRRLGAVPGVPRARRVGRRRTKRRAHEVLKNFGREDLVLGEAACAGQPWRERVVLRDAGLEGRGRSNGLRKGLVLLVDGEDGHG